MPRPMHVVGMQRMPNTGMPAFNVATQTGVGAPTSGNIPMQRGAAAQAHQQQVVFAAICFFPVRCAYFF